MAWTVDVDGDTAPAGWLLALDVDPGQHRLTLAPRPVGSGDARVGMMTRFRRHYPGGLVAELAVAWLGSAEAEALMDQVEAGFCVTRHWTGDEVGEWTPKAWAAAEALFVEVGERLDLQD